MLVEPDLDRAALAAALQRDYGLAASAVRFVPVGETAWCYQVTDEQGGRWFLKLSRPGAIEPARAEFALELGRALAELGLPVPRPQPTRSGALWCWLGGLRLALFEFVHGAPLSDRDLSAAGLTERVAGLAAAVHGATGALAVPVPFAEICSRSGPMGCAAAWPHSRQAPACSPAIDPSAAAGRPGWGAVVPVALGGAGGPHQARPRGAGTAAGIPLGTPILVGAWWSARLSRAYRTPPTPATSVDTGSPCRSRRGHSNSWSA